MLSLWPLTVSASGRARPRLSRQAGGVPQAADRAKSINDHNAANVTHIYVTEIEVTSVEALESAVGVEQLAMTAIARAGGGRVESGPSS